MQKITKASFLKDCVKELWYLRDTITPEQRESLDAEEHNGLDCNQCIYGQVTGDAYEQEAYKLKLASDCTIFCNDCVNPEEETLDGYIAGLNKSAITIRTTFDPEDNGIGFMDSALDIYQYVYRENSPEIQHIYQFLKMECDDLPKEFMSAFREVLYERRQKIKAEIEPYFEGMVSKL